MSQQNKTTLQAAINTQIADNTTGEISAADVRNNLIDITDSLLFNSGSQTFEGSLTVNGGVVGSLQGTATNATNATNADSALTALTANYVPILAGPGISVNGMAVTANVRTVNGVAPSGNGNIPLSLGTVYTGTSASLASTSTASLADASVWIVSGDAVPENNGDAYIYKSASVGQWLTIAPLDEAAGDARYARIGVAEVQSLTSSFAVTASRALIANTASYILGSNVSGYVQYATSSTFASQVYSYPTLNNNEYKLLFTDNYNNGYSTVFIGNNATLTYNPSTNVLTATSSYATTASYALAVLGGGGGGGSAFPYTGNAVITGTLSVSNGITGIVTSASKTYVELDNDNTSYNLLFTNVSDALGGYTAPKYATINPIQYQPGSGKLYVPIIQQGAAVASGIGSHGEGEGSWAYGQFSHAEGYNSFATGPYSHTEGYQTTSSNYYAHAEGYQTKAQGNASHAEGSGTTTIAQYTHAEGMSTTAFAISSHAEGAYSVASGSYSHAEGYGSYAIGMASHAEGAQTSAPGYAAHSEGYNTQASSSYSHAEGSGTYAIGEGSHAEGSGTEASGSYSHAEGQYSIASGSWSHVEGFTTYTSKEAIYAHAEGYYTQVLNQGAHAEGSLSVASGSYSHTEGFQTKTTGSWSHAEGNTTQAIGSYSHAEGSNTRSSGSNSHAEGANTLAQGGSSHAEGYQSWATGSYSHAEGNQTTASGQYSHAEGRITTAFGQWSHAEGFQTRAAGDYSHAEGYLTTASATYSHAEGLGTVTNQQYQLAVGKYNAISAVEGAFTVGNGTTANSRSNVLAAYNNNVDVNGVVTVDGLIGNGLGTIVFPQLVAFSFLNDAAAAAAGIPVGGLYRNGSFIQIRIV
jgi:hypothetical protein